MNKDIELAIDLAAVCTIIETQAHVVDVALAGVLVNTIHSKIQEQVSAQMLLDALSKKYGIVS